MAFRIPDFTALPEANPRPSGQLPVYPSEDPVAGGLAMFGKGISAAGGALVDIGAEQQRKQNQLNAALAEADLEANLYRTKEAIKNERDPAKIDALKAEIPGFLQRAEATITDPDARQLWSAKARLKLLQADAVADAQHRTIYYDRFRAGASQQIDEQIKIASQASDPEERDAAKRRIGQIIGSMEQSGALTAEKAQAATQDVGEKIITGHVDWLSANGRHGEAQTFLQQNGRLIDPQRARQLGDYLKPRVDKEAGISLLDRTAPGAGPLDVEGAPSRGDPRGLVPFIRATAVKYGHDPDVAVKVARSEGLGQFYGDGGKSGTAFQLFTGGGLGNEYQKETGRDPLDPNNEKHAIDWALKNLGRTGWTPYHGAKNVGIGPRQGIGVQPAGGAAPTEDELAAAPEAGAPISLDEPAQPKVPDWQAWMQRIDAAPGFTREQKEHAKAELRSKHNEFALGQSEAASDLQLAIGRGEKAREDVEAAYGEGKISPEKRVQLHNYFDKLEADRAAITEGVARVAAAGNGGAPLDPKSKPDRDALNFHYDAVSRAWQTAVPDQVLDRSVAYAAQYGMVPEKLKAMVRGGLHSGRPDQAVQAAETVSRLRNNNPQLIGEIGDDNDLRLATLISTYTTAGMPAEAALRTAAESMKVSKVEREARADDFDAQRGKTGADREKADKKWIEGKLNSVWTVDPTVDPVMRREFEEIAKTEFERTGNLDASRQMALDTVNRVWGRTRVTGDGIRYMKLAPEKFYGVATMTPEQNAVWMNDQLVADVSKGAFADPRNPITAERLMLVPSPTTGPDGKPAYVVLLKDANGTFNTVTKPDGMPQMWVPDWTSSAEYQRQQTGQKRKVEDLRKLRTSPPPALDFLFRGGATLQEQLSRGSGETP